MALAALFNWSVFQSYLYVYQMTLCQFLISFSVSLLMPILFVYFPNVHYAHYVDEPSVLITEI